MERASRIMYSIANFFTWIIAISAIVGIAFCALSIAGIKPDPRLNWGLLVYCVFLLVFSLITVAMVRRAKGKNTSKAWDVLFLILGIFGSNIFYILGGIFGLCSKD